MADAADEGIPRPATGYTTCRAVVLADVDTVDRCPRRVRHRRPNQRRPPGNQNSERDSPTTTFIVLLLRFSFSPPFTVISLSMLSHCLTKYQAECSVQLLETQAERKNVYPKTVGPPAAENPDGVVYRLVILT